MTDAGRLASSPPHEATRVRVDKPAQEPSSAHDNIWTRRWVWYLDDSSVVAKNIVVQLTMGCWMESGIVSAQVRAWLMCFGGWVDEVENGVRGRYQPGDSSTGGPSRDRARTDLKSAMASCSIKL